MKQRIIDDYNHIIKNKKRYIGKEMLLSEQGYCSDCKNNKYTVIIWGPDSKKDEPHIHIVDTETYGNKINAAYSLITGKPVEKHGSVISNVTNNILSIIYRMLLRNNWKFIITMWNSENNSSYKIKKLPRFKN